MFDPREGLTEFRVEETKKKSASSVFIKFVIRAVIVLVLLILAMRVYHVRQANELASKANRAFAAGNYNEAIASWEEALKNSSFREKTDVVYTNIGKAYLEMKMYRKAIPPFEKAVDINPKAALTFKLLSDCRRLDGDLKGALDAISKASEIEPTNHEYKNMKIVLESRVSRSGG